MLKSCANGALTTKLGTEEYMAPELLEDREEAYAGSPVDVFALGVNLFIIHTARFPFQNSVKDWFYAKFQKDPVKLTARREIVASPEFLDLVRGMTDADPAKRYTLDQVKSHEWMQGETASA